MFLAVFVVFAIGVCIVSFSVTAFMFVIYRRSLLVAHVPGPPVTNRLQGHVSFMVKCVENGQWREQYMYECHVKYGPIIHLWIHNYAAVYTCDISVARKLMNNVTHQKPDWIFRFVLSTVLGQRFLGRGLITNTDHNSWERRHRSISPGFHRRYLKGFVDNFNYSATKFIDRLLNMGQNGAPVAMRKMFPAFALEVIANVAFDEDFDSINNPDHVLRNSLVKASDGTFQFLKSPLKTLLDWKFVKQTREHCRKLRNAGAEIIRKRLRQYSSETATTRNDILDFIIRAANDDPSLTMDDLVDEFVTFFFAGHDTTALALSFTLENILLKPHIERKMLEEIGIVLNGRDDIEFDDLANLDYIGCVFKETLRLHPPSGSAVRSLGEEMTVCGYKLPPAVNLFTSFYVIHRWSSYWDSPLEFNPDRFHDIENNDIQAFMPFALGPRSCVGRQFAEMEVKILLAKLIKRVQFKLLPDEKTGAIAGDILMVPASDINCIVKGRV